jgi:hypothetical protein
MIDITNIELNHKVADPSVISPTFSLSALPPDASLNSSLIQKLVTKCV